jgi:hypothetical protein
LKKQGQQEQEKYLSNSAIALLACGVLVNARQRVHMAMPYYAPLGIGMEDMHKCL